MSEAESEILFSSLIASPTHYAGAIEPENFQQQIARRKFLAAIEHYAPAFLSAVRDEVFPAYAKACVGESTYSNMYGPIPMGWLQIDRRSRRPKPRKFLAVRKKILACAGQFNLTVRHPEGKTLVPAAWACDVIAVTLGHWQQDPTLVGHFPFKSDGFPYGDWVTSLEGRHYTVEVPVNGPNPNESPSEFKMRFVPARGPNPNESFAGFEGRVLPEIRKQLRRDWEATRDRRKNRAQKNADHHFVWFARFQVGGLLPPDIASRIRVPNPSTKSAQVTLARDDETHAIQRSFKSTADALGLTPRHLPKGRPKKAPLSFQADF